jgi:23S rRNA (uracil1939-C5)-methyltransferase
LQKNQVLDLTVASYGAEAEGLCRHEGMVVFVPGGLAGEEIRAQVLKVQKNHAYGKLLEVITSSPARTEPPCPYYDSCGGCSCQHMEYAEELRFKQNLVQDAMRRIGGIDLTDLPILSMENPWRYRNKAALPIASVEEQPRAGFYRRRSHRIVPVDQCLINTRESDAVVPVVLSWMKQNSVPAYSEEEHAGLIRHLVTRTNRQGELMVVLVINGTLLPAADDLVFSLREELPSLHSLHISCNQQRTNAILGQECLLLWGQEHLVDSLCGLEYRLSPLSFFQVNALQAERLYLRALEMAAPTTRDLVMDLYCGAGTISCLFARHCQQVIGIEIVPQAVEDARHNAAFNGIDNAAFHCAAAEVLMPQLVAQGQRPDIVVLDPPRKGAEAPVLQAISQASPRCIVYISCHPGTQARDARLLCNQGWQVTNACAVDMFCKTAGVENILLFERR